MSKSEFTLTLNHMVNIARRGTFTTTAMGQRRPGTEVVVTANASCYFQQMNGKKVNTRSGDFKNADYLMMVQWNQDVQEGDLLYPTLGIVGMTVGRVLLVDPIMDFGTFAVAMTHHADVYVERVG